MSIGESERRYIESRVDARANIYGGEVQARLFMLSFRESERREIERERERVRKDGAGGERNEPESRRVKVDEEEK